MNAIEIDDDVMTALKRKAEPFVDTPNSVLRRLLLLDDSDGRGGASGRKRSRASRRRGSGSGSPASKAQRVPTGSILPEREYMQPLLEVLLEDGGRAPAREVIDKVGRRLHDRLTRLDLETVSSGGVRWQNRVQFARLKLIDRGLLKRESPRGVWELTENGAAKVAPEGKANEHGRRAALQGGDRL